MESYTKKKPVSQLDSIQTYGPHKNTLAFSTAELVVPMSMLLLPGRPGRRAGAEEAETCPT